MRFQFQQAFRAVILFAFFAFLIKIHLNGDILKYVNPKYNQLSQTAAYLFLFLFFVQCTRIWARTHKHGEHCHHKCSHNHGNSGSPVKKRIAYSILIFPLLTGFFLPAKVLNATTASKKGIVLTGETSLQKQGESEAEATSSLYDQEEMMTVNHEVVVDRKEVKKEVYDEKMEQLEKAKVIDMNEEVFDPYYGQISEEPEKYVGRTIKMAGFVYKENGFQPNQLALTRFLITHCVADATTIGFLTEFDKAETLQQDTWIEVEGTIGMTTYDGLEMAVLKVKSWHVINEPKEPYIYPVYIKII